MFQHLESYLHEVFVAKFDFWLFFGLLAQMLFAGRFLVQWISSEIARKSVVPSAFWLLSIAGGLMTLTYGIIRREPIIILGQSFGSIVYLRNVMLIIRAKRLEGVHSRSSAASTE